MATDTNDEVTGVTTTVTPTVSKKSRRGDRPVQAISASGIGPNARGGN